MLRVMATMCLGIVLAGCVSTPKPEQSGSALLMIDVADPGAPRNLPLTMTLELLDTTSGERSRHVFESAPKPRTNPRVFARMNVRAGSYAITRVDAWFGAPGDGPAVNVELHAPFKVGSACACNLGGMLISVSAPPRSQTPGTAAAPFQVAVATRAPKAADAQVWQQIWPDLRQVAVLPLSFDRFEVLDSDPNPTPPNATTTADANPNPRLQLRAFTTVSPSLAAELPATVRGAYLRFLQQPYPRALALGKNGRHEMATGAGAVERALADCNRKSVPAKGCFLMAVDDTILVDPTRVSLGPSDRAAGGSGAAR